MARTNFEIIKAEPILIRPCKKTLNGLYFLSNLDQTYPYPIKVVFAFEKTKKEFIQVMKESLEELLVHYYPFAGCLTKSWDGKMAVQCTGEGVAFVEAVVTDHRIDVLGDISIIHSSNNLRKLVHYVNGEASSILDTPLLTVQVTKFKCGGITLGIVMNHVLVDGRSLAEFINSWGEVSRGMPMSIPPFLDRSLLRPRNPLQINIPHHEFKKIEVAKVEAGKEQHLKCRSFCFGLDTLVKLKEMATSDLSIVAPTSFELISAVLWISRTYAYKIKHDQMTQILTAVDCRAKFDTPLPKGYFGNGIVWSCARCNAGDLTRRPFSFAVKIVQQALRDVTEDYVKSAIDYYEATRAELEKENTFCITKWTRLTFYDTDFGWGKPTRVAPASAVDDLMVTLSQGKESENTIVSLSLPDYVMDIFQGVMQEQFGIN